MKARQARRDTAFLIVLAFAAPASAQTPLQSADLSRLRSVSDAQLSPDGTRIVYSVVANQGPRRPTSEMWVMDVTTGQGSRVAGSGGGAEWAPDSRSFAYIGSSGETSGLMIAGRDGAAPALLAPVQGTNSPLPSVGRRIAWSPDGRRIAFVSATAGPETNDPAGDPIVVTRYLYKPPSGEGPTRFNDNRRLHIFVVDVATKAVRQLTDGAYHEHSIDWSPNGDDIVFISNREPDPDRVFNNDLFVVGAGDGAVRRLTSTENAEYRPRWSPDGKTIAYQATRRGITCIETTMEDTHIWAMASDGTARREIGGLIDNRQGGPQWSADGGAVYFTVTERGSVALYRLPMSGGAAQPVVAAAGSVGAWSIGKHDAIAYTFHSPKDLPQLHVTGAGATRQLTDLNKDVLSGAGLAQVEAFTFVGSDSQFTVEAFLTHPLGRSDGSKHPLIVSLHGGPHGQSGPAFNFKSQVYASRGWATLMVNFRGSIGYGQRFADAIFGDHSGREAQDVLLAVGAALRRYPWLDRDRLGVEGTSFGGELTNWLITQTNMFKAAIPIAGVSNLISVAYMSYVKQYIQVEFGGHPHEGDLMNVLWERSPLKHVAKVRTPTLFIHGELDNDVPIAEAEQYYMALRDVGVETVMLRYPREGHGLRETKHIIDSIDRSMEWYARHFGSTAALSRAAQ